MANLHLQHLEDGILTRGIPGAHETLNTIDQLINTLSGSRGKHTSITTKWDGSPAIVAGKDPKTGKFFVGTKSVFNKREPKLIFTDDDVDRYYAEQPALALKLKFALQYLKKLGIKNVLQGDLMFTPGDVRDREFEGQVYTTFKPNTIMYAVPYDSDLADRFRRAKVGIVFHTSYSGDDFQTMTPSFKVDLSQLKRSEDVWFDDATYQDETGSVKLSGEEVKSLKQLTATAERILDEIDVLQFQRLTSDNALVQTLKLFSNEQVRAGRTYDSSYDVRFRSFAAERYVAKYKTQKARQNAEQQLEMVMPTIKLVIAFQNTINQVKLLLVKKLNQIKTINTFVQDGDGYRVTSPEGFVAVDHLTNNAVKLVDRLEFSRANFKQNESVGLGRVRL